MFKMIFQSLILCLFFSLASIAEIIKDVKIEGNKRISKESIIVFGEIDFNKSYSTDDLNIILKNIYDTNFFKDIDIKINNSILEISVINEHLILVILTHSRIKHQRSNNLRITVILAQNGVHSVV